MRGAERLFPIGLAVLAAALVVGELAIGHDSAEVIAFPLIAALLLVVLTGLQVVRPGPGVAVAESEPEAEPEPALRAAEVVWIVAILPAVLILGFRFGPALYLAAYLKAHGGRWWVAAAAGLACAALSHLVFERVLGLRLPGPELLR